MKIEDSIMSTWHSLSGYLHYKPGGALTVFKSKRKVWCVLDEQNHQLLYFKNEDDVRDNTACQGRISIGDCAINLDLDNQNQFVILSQGKDHIFTAENHESMMIWLLALQSRTGCSDTRQMAYSDSYLLEANKTINQGGLTEDDSSTTEYTPQRSQSLVVPPVESKRERFKENRSHVNCTTFDQSSRSGSNWASLDKNSRMHLNWSTIDHGIIHNLNASSFDQGSVNIIKDSSGNISTSWHQDLSQEDGSIKLVTHSSNGSTESDDVFVSETSVVYPIDTRARYRNQSGSRRSSNSPLLRQHMQSVGEESRSSTNSVSSDSAIDRGDPVSQTQVSRNRILELESDLIQSKCELAKVMNVEAFYQDLIEQKNEAIKDLTERLEKSDSECSSVDSVRKGDVHVKPVPENIRILQNQNKILNKEIKRLAQMRVGDRSVFREQQMKLQAAEADTNTWKAEYVKIIQSSIRLSDIDTNDEPVLKLYGGSQPFRKVQELLLEARRYNPGLPSYESLCIKDTHVDNFGFRHIFENEGLLLHYLCQELHLHYMRQAVAYSEHCSHWKMFMRQYGKTLSKDIQEHWMELNNLCTKGIPDEFRKQVWGKLIYGRIGDIIEKKGAHYFRNLCNTIPNSPLAAHYKKQISLDLMRTMPDNIRFSTAGSKGIMDLQDVLLAYCLHNPSTGYCQGMNFIAGMFLLFLDANDSFWALIAVTERYFCSNYFDHNLIGAQADQFVLQDLVSEKLPKLALHFESMDIEISTVTLNWFLAIFFDSVPFQTLLRIWDIFLLEGPNILFRFSLAILKMNESELLQRTDTISVMKYLKGCAKLTYDIEGLFQLFDEMDPPRKPDIVNLRTSYLKKLKEKYRKQEYEYKISRHSDDAYLVLEAEAASIQHKAIICATEISKDGKLWFCFSDESTSHFCQVNCQTGLMNEVSWSIDSPVLCMTTYQDKTIVLGLLSWMVVAFDTQTMKEVWSLHCHDAVLALCYYSQEGINRIFAGLADGTIAAIDQPKNQQTDLDVLYIPVGQSPVTSLIVHGTQLWCASGNSVLIFHASTLDGMDSLVVSQDPYDIVQNLCCSDNGVWMSFRGSSIIELWDTGSLHCKLLYNCHTGKCTTHKKVDDEFNKARITSMLALNETVWIGTGDGNLVIYEIIEQVQANRSSDRFLELKRMFAGKGHDDVKFPAYPANLSKSLETFYLERIHDFSLSPFKKAQEEKFSTDGSPNGCTLKDRCLSSPSLLYPIADGSLCSDFRSECSMAMSRTSTLNDSLDALESHTTDMTTSVSTECDDFQYAGQVSELTTNEQDTLESQFVTGSLVASLATSDPVTNCDLTWSSPGHSKIINRQLNDTSQESPQKDGVHSYRLESNSSFVEIIDEDDENGREGSMSSDSIEDRQDHHGEDFLNNNSVNESLRSDDIHLKNIKNREDTGEAFYSIHDTLKVVENGGFLEIQERHEKCCDGSNVIQGHCVQCKENASHCRCENVPYHSNCHSCNSTCVPSEHSHDNLDETKNGNQTEEIILDNSFVCIDEACPSAESCPNTIENKNHRNHSTDMQDYSDTEIIENTGAPDVGKYADNTSFHDAEESIQTDVSQEDDFQESAEVFVDEKYLHNGTRAVNSSDEEFQDTFETSDNILEKQDVCDENLSKSMDKSRALQRNVELNDSNEHNGIIKSEYRLKTGHVITDESVNIPDCQTHLDEEGHPPVIESPYSNGLKPLERFVRDIIYDVIYDIVDHASYDKCEQIPHDTTKQQYSEICSSQHAHCFCLNESGKPYSTCLLDGSSDSFSKESEDSSGKHVESCENQCSCEVFKGDNLNKSIQNISLSHQCREQNGASHINNICHGSSQTIQSCPVGGDSKKICSSNCSCNSEICKYHNNSCGFSGLCNNNVSDNSHLVCDFHESYNIGGSKSRESVEMKNSFGVDSCRANKLYNNGQHIESGLANVANNADECNKLCDQPKMNSVDPSEMCNNHVSCTKMTCERKSGSSNNCESFLQPMRQESTLELHNQGNNKLTLSATTCDKEISSKIPCCNSQSDQLKNSEKNLGPSNLGSPIPHVLQQSDFLRYKNKFQRSNITDVKRINLNSTCCDQSITNIGENMESANVIDCNEISVIEGSPMDSTISSTPNESGSSSVFADLNDTNTADSHTIRYRLDFSGVRIESDADPLKPRTKSLDLAASTPNNIPNQQRRKRPTSLSTRVVHSKDVSFHIPQKQDSLEESLQSTDKSMQFKSSTSSNSNITCDSSKLCSYEENLKSVEKTTSSKNSAGTSLTFPCLDLDVQDETSDSSTDRRIQEFLRTPSFSLSASSSLFSSYDNISMANQSALEPGEGDADKHYIHTDFWRHQLSTASSTSSIWSDGETSCLVKMNLLVKMKISDKPIRYLIPARCSGTTNVVSFSGCHGDDEAVLVWRKDLDGNMWTNDPVMEICEKTKRLKMPSYMRASLTKKSPRMLTRHKSAPVNGRGLTASWQQLSVSDKR